MSNPRESEALGTQISEGIVPGQNGVQCLPVLLRQSQILPGFRQRKQHRESGHPKTCVIG